MTLYLIIISIIVIAFIIDYIPKYSKYMILFAVLSIISLYYILSYNYAHQYFFPQEYRGETDSKYNNLVYAIKDNKLYIADIKDFSPEANQILQKKDIYKIYNTYKNNSEFSKLFDSTLYKNKIYVYWGITPVLLFYLPFNLITCLYLSDSLLVFFLVSFIFICSLLIMRTYTKDFLQFKLKPSLQIISIFSIGLCNYAIVLAIKSKVYEVAIACAISLLFLSIFLFLKYLLVEDTNKRNKLIFCMGLLLSLAVGCRPHYVLFIPIFFITILCMETKTKNIIKASVCFILPCVIYGSIISIYNYIRFDSIFEFGWKYQLNHLDQLNYVATFKDFFIGLKYNLFQMPEITSDNYTVFSLALGQGHRIANEFVVGLVYVYPMSLLLLLIPLYKNFNNRIKEILLLLAALFTVNFLISSLFGMMRRYAFEYISIAVILSLMIFFYLLKSINNRTQRVIILVFFSILVIYTIYINISLLLCMQDSLFFINTDNVKFYTSIINFLFNNNISPDFFLHKDIILNSILN